MARLLWVVAVVVASTACMTPRSVALGNTAAALGPGKHEVAVTGGFSWQTETVAPTVEETNTATVTTYQTSSGIQFPAAEANVQFGLTRLFGLNLHVSPAGIQPGLKMTLLERGVVLGLLPELGFGWANGATQQTIFNNATTVPTDPTWMNRILLNAGARVLLFHPGSGAYGGVGYQFQSFLQRSASGTGNNEVKQSQADSLHNILAAVGYELKTGSLRIRPELAISITPERSTSVSVNDAAATSRSGGNAFFLFPNVTFAIQGEPSARDEGEEADEDRERRREDGDEDEDDDDDLDENARVKKRVKKAAPPPKEEETQPTKRKTSTFKSEDDEEKKKDEDEGSESDSESSD